MKPPSFAHRDSIDTVCPRGAMALFSALLLALAAGLVTCGPVGWEAAARHGVEPAGAWLDALALMASVTLILAGLRGWRALRRAGAKRVSAPAWRGFYASLAVLGLGCGLHHAIGVGATRLLLELCCSAGFALLFLGLMAERVDPRFASATALALGLLVAAGATAWWAWGWLATGSGDVRGLLFVETLPLLLLPAGVAGLPAGDPRAGDGLTLLGLFALARLAMLAGETLLPIDGALGARAAMLICSALAATWFTQRLSPSRAAATDQDAGPPEGASKSRSTSLNTSG